VTRLAVVGSLNTDVTLLLDHLPGHGETVLAAAPGRLSFGGKGGNQAAAAAAFGAEVAMVGRVGDDEPGRQVLADLAGRGIDVGRVTATQGVRTGSATIAVAADGENLILVDPGANGRLEADDVATAGLDQADAVLLQLEIPLPTVTAAMQAAGDALVLLNPAPAVPLPPGALALAGVLVPNRAELAQLAGEEVAADLAAAARQARQLTGHADVVVTLGRDGVLVVPASAGPVAHIAAPSVATVDTTGAGDCFCGTLAVGLAEGLALADAARLSVAAAAISTTALGARGQLPGRTAAERLAAALTVRAVRG
jgi:ribokinase